MIYPSRWLPLLAILLLAACGPAAEPVTIVWTNERATGLILRHLDASETDLLKLEVSLVTERERSPVLGTFELSGDEITFTPIVPLTRGLAYELLEDGKVFGEISIPVSDAPAPEIIKVYPLTDTVPENLLKVHFDFSQAMQEGKSGQFLKLVRNERDTLDGTFLDLQPELWDASGTILTLWLDPGRIKLDLIPNKELGNPLTKGSTYALVVLPGWNSKEGVPLPPKTAKTFVVGDRDDESPDVNKWVIEPPTNDNKILTINFGEPLDWLLTTECIQIIDELGRPYRRIVNQDVKGIRVLFESPLPAGQYTLTVQSRLEDLAGNNLNRLFEVDLTMEVAKSKERESFVRTFEVK